MTIIVSLFDQISNKHKLQIAPLLITSHFSFSNEIVSSSHKSIQHSSPNLLMHSTISPIREPLDRFSRRAVAATNVRQSHRIYLFPPRALPKFRAKTNNQHYALVRLFTKLRATTTSLSCVTVARRAESVTSPAMQYIGFAFSERERERGRERFFL